MLVSFSLRGRLGWRCCPACSPDTITSGVEGDRGRVLPSAAGGPRQPHRRPPRPRGGGPPPPPPRPAASAACRFAIDTLKAKAPIWKKEHYADGSAWLEGPGTTTP